MPSDEQVQREIPQKNPRVEGEFSGAEARKPRVEDWMEDAPVPQKSSTTQSPSYRDILQPRKTGRPEDMMETPDEDWDGSLVGSDVEEMRKGVSVADSDDGPSIEFTEEEKCRLEKKWGKSLIIKLLGGSLGFMQLRRKIQTMWGIGGRVELSDIGNGYFIASFQDVDDYFFALEGGPWLIQNHYLTVQTWKRNFQSNAERIRNVAVWVRLPGLPRDYYDRKFFFNLGNKIGKAIKVDEMTLKRARTMYARMCVEVDINKPLLPSYSVDGTLLKIEYEGLQCICFHCGKFGHAEQYCPVKANSAEKAAVLEQQSRMDLNAGEAAMAPANGGGGKYGEWMIAQDPRRAKRGGFREGTKKDVVDQGRKSENIGGPSRFDILGMETERGDRDSDTGEQRVPMKDISNGRGERIKETWQQTKVKTNGGPTGSDKTSQKGQISADLTEDREERRADRRTLQVKEGPTTKDVQSGSQDARRSLKGKEVGSNSGIGTGPGEVNNKEKRGDKRKMGPMVSKEGACGPQNPIAHEESGSVQPAQMEATSECEVMTETKEPPDPARTSLMDVEGVEKLMTIDAEIPEMGGETATSQA